MRSSNRLTDWLESMASASRATASASATLHDAMARLSSGIKGALTLNSSRPRPSSSGVARRIGGQFAAEGHADSGAAAGFDGLPDHAQYGGLKGIGDRRHAGVRRGRRP